MAMDKKNKKIKTVIEKFEHGNLHSGSKSGPVVKDKSQAIAIGESEARKGKRRGGCKE